MTFHPFLLEMRDLAMPLYSLLPGGTSVVVSTLDFSLKKTASDSQGMNAAWLFVEELVGPFC